MRWFPVVAVPLLLLSGCAATGSEPEPTSPPAEEEAAPSVEWGVIPQPTWNVGDWWQYDITVERDFTGLRWTYTVSPTIVVVAAGPNGYWTAVTERDDEIVRRTWAEVWGSNHSRDLDPMVPLDAADGGREETPFDLYRWPLKVGTSWNANAAFAYAGVRSEGGLSFEVAEFENATIGGKMGQVAHVHGEGPLEIVGTGGEEIFQVDYAWAEQARNVASLTIANETLTPARLVLRAYGTNYTGQVTLHGRNSVYFGLKLVAPAAPTAESVPKPEPFKVTQQADFLLVTAGIGVFTPGRASVSLVDPSNSMTEYVNDQAAFRWFVQQRPVLTGDWAASYNLAAASFGFLAVSAVHEDVLNFVQGAPDRPPPA